MMYFIANHIVLRTLYAFLCGLTFGIIGLSPYMSYNDCGTCCTNTNVPSNGFMRNMFEKIEMALKGKENTQDNGNEVKVLCWIMTTSKNAYTRAIHLRNTWTKRCTKTLFLSDKNDSKIPAIAISDSKHRYTYNSYEIANKAFKSLQYIYQHHFSDADWFLKTDDDTYVIMENLRHFLSLKNAADPVYYGRLFKAFNVLYFSGGAGYVMSKEALKRIATHPCPLVTGMEDIEVGRCLKTLGVEMGYSFDEFGKTLFHPFPLIHHLQNQYPEWYFKKDPNAGPKKLSSSQPGMPHNVSRYPVSFHYLLPKEFYDMEYLVYHLRAHGIEH